MCIVLQLIFCIVCSIVFITLDEHDVSIKMTNVYRVTADILHGVL